MAKGRMKPETAAVKIKTGHGRVESGLHEAAGGDGSYACTGDMLLESLAACVGVTLEAVATAMGIAIRRGRITAEGDIDFRGTLGVDKTVPVGITDIRLHFDLDTDATTEKIDKLPYRCASAADIYRPSTLRIRSRAQSTSSWVITSGGANRMVFSWVSLHSSPSAMSRSQ